MEELFAYIFGIYKKFGGNNPSILAPFDSVSVATYSRVPNKRTGRLLENEKKSHLYALIQDYTFINFQQKVPPIRLFPPILLLIFKEISHLYFYSEPSSIRNSRVLTFVKLLQVPAKVAQFPSILVKMLPLQKEPLH